MANMPLAPFEFDPPPRRILIIMPTWVGDVVMATPLLRAVRRRFNSANVTLLMAGYQHDLLRGHPGVDDCVFWPAKGRHRPWHREYRVLVGQMRARRFDLAILLPNSFRVAWFAWEIRARRRVGYSRDGRGWLLTDRVPVTNRVGRGFRPVPLVDYYADLAERLGCDRPGDELTLTTTPDCEKAVETRLANLGVGDRRPLIVICPGAKFGASKCWLPERFAAVARGLLAQHGGAVVVSPGPGEEPLARAIADAMTPAALTDRGGRGGEGSGGGATVLDGPCLSLGELKALIRRADLLLGNDTGPRHFARAFGIPMVTVFGPTDPRWTATGYPQERIVRVEVECGPCHKKVCPLGHLQCMTLVTVDMVQEACAQLLAEKTR